MSDKIELKEKLAAVDMGAKDMWDELNADQQKALKSEFFILNRYVSSAKGQKREIQEHFVLTVNEYFNKHWNLLQKHPKLMWQLLCMCSHESRKIVFHEWMGFKKKKGDSKMTKALLEIYPNKKQDELEMMAQLMTKKEFKELAEQHGYTDKEIAKLVA
jgi:predicted transcriptional regulator